MTQKRLCRTRWARNMQWRDWLLCVLGLLPQCAMSQNTAMRNETDRWYLENLRHSETDRCFEISRDFKSVLPYALT